MARRGRDCDRRCRRDVPGVALDYEGLMKTAKEYGSELHDYLAHGDKLVWSQIVLKVEQVIAAAMAEARSAALAEVDHAVTEAADKFAREEKRQAAFWVGYASGIVRELRVLSKEAGKP